MVLRNDKNTRNLIYELKTRLDKLEEKYEVSTKYATKD